MKFEEVFGDLGGLMAAYIGCSSHWLVDLGVR